MIIDEKFLSNIPTTGFLEFDYAGTSRPAPAELYYPPEDEDVYEEDSDNSDESQRKRESGRYSSRRRSSDSARGMEKRLGLGQGGQDSVGRSSVEDRRGSTHGRRGGEGQERRSSMDYRADERDGLVPDAVRKEARRSSNERRSSKNDLNNRRASSSRPLESRRMSSDSSRRMDVKSSEPYSGIDKRRGSLGYQGIPQSVAAPQVAHQNENDFDDDDYDDNAEISDQQFDHLMFQLGLTSRKKFDNASILYTILELQLAAANYYFPVRKVLQLILSYFGQESPLIKAKVVICLISRISDLHNFELIMRSLKGKAQSEIISRVGWLNIFNPLKPAFNYVIPLKCWDNRILVSMLLQMGNAESSDDVPDQLKEDPKTEVTVVSLEEGINELHKKNIIRDDTVQFSYGEIAERTLIVNWETRKEMLKKCLLGTGIYEDDDDEEEYRKRGVLDGNNIYHIITWYNLIAAANAFTTGPLDLQYATYAKSDMRRSLRRTSSSKK